MYPCDATLAISPTTPRLFHRYKTGLLQLASAPECVTSPTLPIGRLAPRALATLPAALLAVRDPVRAALTSSGPLDPEALRKRVAELIGPTPRWRLHETETRTILSEVAQSPNAAAALETFGALAPYALPDEVRRALVLGVSRPRTLAPEGAMGILRPAQAVRAVKALAALAPAERMRFDRLLANTRLPAGAESDSELEAGLLLKMLAARTSATANDFKDLSAFARTIRGLPRYALVHVTTLVDVDSGRNTSRRRIDDLTAKHPTRAPAPNDDAAANGLLQLFDSSCGPTSCEVLRGEADPSYALAVHIGGGPQSLLRGGLSHEVQAAWLRHFDDPARRRRGTYDYFRVRELGRELVAQGALTAGEHLALLRLCRSEKRTASEVGLRALERLRDAHAFPTDHDLARMRSSLPATTTVGTSAAELLEVFTKMVTPYSGAEFRFRNVAANRLTNEALAELAATIQAGPGTVIGTSDHWWAAVDARRAGDDWLFTIHDPWTGITASVPSAELADGTFARTRFGWPRRTGWSGFYVLR